MYYFLIFFLGFILGASRERVLAYKHGGYLAPEQDSYEILSVIENTNTFKSIKRLSDGVVFTVGDKVRVKGLSYGPWELGPLRYNSHGQLVTDCSEQLQAMVKNLQHVELGIK